MLSKFLANIRALKKHKRIKKKQIVPISPKPGSPKPVSPKTYSPKPNKNKKKKNITIEIYDNLDNLDKKDTINNNIKKSPRNCVNNFAYKTPLLIPLILNDLCYLKEPVNKKMLQGKQCVTCGKIFIGPKNGQRLLQHCDSLNHKYY